MTLDPRGQRQSHVILKWICQPFPPTAKKLPLGVQNFHGVSLPGGKTQSKRDSESDFTVIP